MALKNKLTAIAGDKIDKSLDHKSMEEIIGRDAKQHHNLVKPHFEEAIVKPSKLNLFQYLCSLYNSTHAHGNR